MKFHIVSIAFLVCSAFLAICVTAHAQLPNTLVMDANRLLELKKQHQQQPLKIVADLRKEADSLLNMNPVSLL
jgi:hypothetical protein